MFFKVFSYMFFNVFFFCFKKCFQKKEVCCIAHTVSSSRAFEEAADSRWHEVILAQARSAIWHCRQHNGRPSMGDQEAEHGCRKCQAQFHHRSQTSRLAEIFGFFVAGRHRVGWHFHAARGFARGGGSDTSLVSVRQHSTIGSEIAQAECLSV